MYEYIVSLKILGGSVLGLMAVFGIVGVIAQLNPVHTELNYAVLGQHKLVVLFIQIVVFILACLIWKSPYFLLSC